MKRALYFFLLAALVWLVVQPNLAAGTREPEVRVPVYGVDLQTSTQITKDQCDSQSVIVIDPAAGGRIDDNHGLRVTLILGDLGAGLKIDAIDRNTDFRFSGSGCQIGLHDQPDKGCQQEKIESSFHHPLLPSTD